MLTFGSLFAGIGGFDLGFHQEGLSCAWQVEIDQSCRSVLARHWPDVLRFADVRECGADILTPVDVICGGFPCQDLSVAGNRAGLAGERSGLFYEMTRICDELQPAFLVWENVPGLLSSRSGKDFLRVLVELDRIGYSGCWSTLDAQFFGLAQRRQRVFGVFARSDIGAGVCCEILSLASRLPWNTEKSGEKRARVANAITRSAGHHGRSSPRGDGSDNLIAHTLTANYGKQVDSSDTNQGPPNLILEEPYTLDWMAGSSGDTSFRGKARSWIVDKPGRSRALTANRTLAVFEPAGERVRNALASHHGRNSGEDTLVAFNFKASYDAATENIAPTITHGGPNGGTSRDAASTPAGIRRLTPLECERLQGFPDGWTAGQSDSARYRQLGNAVAVPVATWIGGRIVETECAKKQRKAA